VAQDRDRLRSVGNREQNFGSCKIWGMSRRHSPNFTRSEGTISCSIRVLLYEVIIIIIIIIIITRNFKYEM